MVRSKKNVCSTGKRPPLPLGILNRPITITIVPRQVITRSLGIWAGFTLFDWQRPRLLNWLNEWENFKGKINAQNGRSGGENAS